MLDNELTRRQLLVRSAAAAAGLSLSMSLLAAKRAQAQVDLPPDKNADNVQLNILLGAEYNAIAIYAAGAAVIAADATADADTKDTVTKVATHFRTQHIEHAAALADFITKNGGTPVTAPAGPTIPQSFKDAPQTVGNVIKLAADKEKQAAFTYADILHKISVPAAAKLVAAIGGVESQHFVVLYLLDAGYVAANTNTNSMASLVVPASFVLNVGLAGTTNLEVFPDLDNLLAFDPPPP